MKKIVRIKEDAPTNSIGTGAIAGAGVGPQGEPGVDKSKKRFMKMLRRNSKKEIK